ncbi:MAG: T9SS type A sorting domain-containing protein [Vicingaceae bacterium]
MNKNIKSIGAIIALFLSSQIAVAQCAAGEVEVTIDVLTDQYGYEGYWELVPLGNACGTGTIFSGGNSAVGCNGAGAQAQTPGGYGNNTTISAGPFCLVENDCFDIKYIDDWNDQGFEFAVAVNGYNINNFIPVGNGVLTASFCASEPPATDAGVVNVSSPVLYDSEGLKEIKGIIENLGTATITSLDINYSIDGGNITTAPLSGLSIANAQTGGFTHPTPWLAPLGQHTVKVWTSNINGTNDDNNAANDTVTSVVNIVPGVPNIIDSYIGVTPVITQIGNVSDQLDKPTDLDFHPDLARKELWVVNKRTENSGGSVVIYNDAGDPGQTDQQLVDGNAWHFMSLPTAIAFSGNSNFATSQGVWDANHSAPTGSGSPFTGPSLWSSDLAIFAQNAGPGTNGSHLDMLHESPWGQGIASETANVFWLNDGNSNDIVRYDFAEDHGPGNDYHGDATVYRYTGVNTAKDPNNKVSSHLVVSDGWVYCVDYGNDKVFRIEMGTGTAGGTPSYGQTEPLVAYENVTGFTVNDVVNTGLVEPTGIDVIDDRMIVSDYNTGDVIIYDIANMPATELGRIATGATGIMGIKIGPNGKIWYVDYDANTVNRIDGATVGIDTKTITNEVSVYPNPTNNKFVVNLKGALLQETTVSVYNVTGKLVYNQKITANQLSINTENWANGIYQIRIENATQSISEKMVVQH